MRPTVKKQVFSGIILVSVFVLGSFAFAGCIGQEEAVFTVVGPWSGAEYEVFKPVLDAFTEKTGIAVNYTSIRAEDLATLLPAQFEAEKTPGDLLFMWAWWAKEHKDDLLDLSDIIDINDFTEVANQGMVDGAMYAAPYTGKLKPGFWYRKSFFEANGLSVPTSYAEFVSLCDKIEAIDGVETAIASGDGVGWPLSDVTEHFLLAYGGVDLFEGLKAGTVSWTSPEVTKVFEDYLVPLIADGHFSEPKEWTLILEDWWAGKHGLYFMGSWITGMVEDPQDLGVFSLPEAKAFVFAGPDFFCIPKYTDNENDAKELAQFLAGAEGQKIQVAQGGHVATHLDVKMSDYKAGVDQEVGALLEGATTVTDLDDTIGGEFQTNFWDQLKFLWVHPEDLATVLAEIEAKA
ncbi:MAG: ABC transporter substrate-binding protein [Candidatus Heimdallarchaeota archaeon]